KGKGVHRRDGRTGDLLLTVQVAVPSTLDSKAKDALEAYAKLTADLNPRAEIDRFVDKEPR
ncbi:MAG: molecular chaperone DnaJ, partial [Sciscionella sp.]|nr:molecular chaperone DnaJ [Sciscionella sp.]